MATVKGSEFAALIGEMVRFPAGANAGKVHLFAEKSRLTIARMGVALSFGRMEIEGDLPLTAVSETELSAFRAICSSAAKVVIEPSEKELKFKCRGREWNAVRLIGHLYNQPVMPKATLEVTEELAEKVGWLADAAYKDSIKPELNCVMLSGDGRAIAVNQRSCTVFDLKSSSRAAVPLVLAKDLKKGDLIGVGENEILLRSGKAIHALPLLIPADRKFPLEQIDIWSKIKSKTVAKCVGSKIAQAIAECDSMLSQSSKTDMVLTVKSMDGKLELATENGSARFRSHVTAECNNGTEPLRIPMEAIRGVTGFIAEEDKLTLSVGDKNGEVLFKFSDGWMLFPRWKD